MRTMLAITMLALLASSCGESAGADSKAEGSKSGGAKTGSELYASQTCATCHGPSGTGTVFGPTLHGKKSFWTREKLVAYLKNPTEYKQTDPRLVEQGKKYSLPMSRFDHLSEAQLSQIADHVLAMP